MEGSSLKFICFIKLNVNGVSFSNSDTCDQILFSLILKIYIILQRLNKLRKAERKMKCLN